MFHLEMRYCTVSHTETLKELITCLMRRSQGEMYIGHARLCLSVCPSPHDHTTARTQM